MEYTYTELMAYIYIYSFLGWVAEAAVMSVRKRKFCNRGFFNLPVCLSYGIIFSILIVIFPTLNERYVFQFIVASAVVSVVEFLSGAMAKSICRKSLWKYESNSLFGIEKKGIIFSVMVTAVIMFTMHLIQPVIFVAVHIVPGTVMTIICLVFTGFLILDLITIIYAVHVSKTKEDINRIKSEKQEGKIAFGNNICRLIWRRLNKAYPDMEQDIGKDRDKYVFARGICLDKLLWVFLICAFGGDIVETIFCRVTAGEWMSRSSVIYGAFSIVWGLGAALLTIVLQKMAQKEDRYVFLAGCVLGGVYEYVCSVFTEVFFGTVFWDYSHMKFNIGGRVNLLYCIFWGIVAVIWIKICYPKISGWIEKIPPLGGKIATWIIIVLMGCDALISAAAMSRYVDRKAGNEAENVIEEFIDYHYTDELVEKVWPNMKVR